MVRLSPSDFRRALDFLREAETVDGPDPFPSHLLDRLRELVGCDAVSFCELDRPRERVLLLEGCSRARELDVEPPADAARTFWFLRHQHPTCAHQDRTHDFAAYKLSDFLTRAQLHRLEIYAEFFRPLGVEYELEVGLPAPPTHTKVFLFARQSSDFSERERLLLNLLRPHFVSLYAAARDRQVLAALEEQPDSPRRLVVCGRNSSIEFAGPDAVELLDRYFGADAACRLPDVLHDWLRGDQVSRSLSVERGDRRLVVRRLGNVLHLQEETARLTRREQEILDLVADGASNRQIGESLHISPGTVRIHLQHVYEKLGVSSRTAALARARQLTGTAAD